MGYSANPLEILLDKAEIKVNQVEAYRDLLKPEVDSFRTSTITDYDWKDITDPSDVTTKLANLTAENLGASTSNMGVLGDLATDCINEVMGDILNYVGNIMSKITDSLDDLLSGFNESAICKKLQEIMSLLDKYNISGLISLFDTNITCITSVDDLGVYTAQIDALNTRIDSVISDLYLSTDGSFDLSTLTAGASAELVDNIESYIEKSETLKTEVETIVNDGVDRYRQSSNVNRRTFW